MSRVPKFGIIVITAIVAVPVIANAVLVFSTMAVFMWHNLLHELAAK